MSWYVVLGEKDGKSPELSQAVLKRFMVQGYDALYVEYKGRGHEHFFEEVHNLFEWMDRKQRLKFPDDFSANSARPDDNSFYWLTVDNFIPAVLMDPKLFELKKVRPAQIGGRLSALTNTVNLTVRGPKTATLWLSAEMLDFQQVVTVRANGRNRFRGMVKPSIETLLDDFQTRGDRQKMFVAQIPLDRL